MTGFFASPFRLAASDSELFLLSAENTLGQIPSTARLYASVDEALGGLPAENPKYCFGPDALAGNGNMKHVWYQTLAG